MVDEPPFLIRLARPNVGEEEVSAIRGVFASGTLTNGPRTAEFEAAFARRHQVQEAVAFANGTVALTAMYLALDIGPGDEVIVPSLTFISSATSVVHAGATPVFADVESATYNLDPESVQEAIGPQTKAVLAVHYGGQPGDLDALRRVADEAGILLLEDAAQAHGSSYQGNPVGGFGRCAMFSFTPTKNITTGEGGLVTTNDPDVAERLRLLRNHGQESLYQHSLLGYNWRISEMQAAMGVVQLGKLDRILDVKRRNARWMTDRLSDVTGITPPVELEGREHVYMLYTLVVHDGRDRLLKRLASEGVEARFYFPPAHRQKVFAHQGREVNLPVTDKLERSILSIPMHAQLSEEELEKIASVIEKEMVRG